MKNRVIIVALLLALFGALIAPAAAQESSGITVVTSANLNVRSLPDANSPSLQLAPQGTTLPVYGRDGSGNWLQVGYKGVVGWVSVFYVSAVDTSSLPVVDNSVANPNRVTEQTTAPDGTVVQNGTLVVFANFSDTNIRSLPNDNSTALAVIPAGTRVTVTRLDSTRSWGLVNFNGVSGWVALFVVNVLGDIRTVPIEGNPGSGSNLPVPSSNVFSLEQREIVERAQSHLGRYLDDASVLFDLLNGGANGGLIICGPATEFMRSYRPTARELSLVPELSAVATDMNLAFRDLNRARAYWLSACGFDKTLTADAATAFASWLAIAQTGLNTLVSAQTRLAELSAR